MSSEEFVPNDRLHRARSRKGWSQAELAEKVGTSFEMVSRWERGVTVPSPHYRRRLCAVLGQTAEELGLVHDVRNGFTAPSSPYVLLACSHADTEKAIVSQLKTTLHGRGIALWNSRQFGRQGTEQSRAVLHEVVRDAQAILVIVSPEARSSRRVRDAFQMARMYQRPVCGVWIDGEHWEGCLPERYIELVALIDARDRVTPTILEEIAIALEQARPISQNGTEVAQPRLPETPTAAVPLVGLPGEIHSASHSSEQPSELVTPQSQGVEVASPSDHSLEPTNGARPITHPLPTKLPVMSNGKRPSLRRMVLLIGGAILLIIGGLSGSFSLLTHFGTLGRYSKPAALTPVHGGTWTYGLPYRDATSFIPNGSSYAAAAEVDQALYLPLFYGDAQGVVQAGAATEVPTVQNGGVSTDATTWTFHLRPHLIWSDGQPYDARDVNYTWRLWANPKFPAGSTLGLNLIRSTEISTDHLSITFHLTRPFAPFLTSLWMDGLFAPLPAHRFSSMAPDQILKSPDNLNPTVTSGPFMMSESVPGDHYTVVRNPRYYRAREGLPYLNKINFLIVNGFDPSLKKLQAGTIDATGLIQDIPNHGVIEHLLKNYTLVYPAAQIIFEALYFNFHNAVLATHPEVRQAMAMAVDQQSIITQALQGLGTPLCTDHSSAYHPGYEPDAPCPLFNLATANKLLDDNGWVKGADGVRAKGRERLEFEYSTTTNQPWRPSIQSIIQRDFGQIGIKLDIQNYPDSLLFGSVLPAGKASPSTGAVAGRYDIAEFNDFLSYDPDDSSLFACNQFPPVGWNLDFYCNPSLDKLFAQEQATADPGVRQLIFQQIHQMYLTQFPFIVLYDLSEFALVHKGMHNYLPGPFDDGYNIAEWWCDNGKC
jgi:peptide/nickel transport system substrate-binding protein